MRRLFVFLILLLYLQTTSIPVNQSHKKLIHYLKAYERKTIQRLNP